MLTPRTAAPALLTLALLLPAARAADVDPYAPADSEWVLRINLKQLAEAPVVKKSAADLLQSALKGKPELLVPLTALGVDPLKEVDTLTAAGSGLPEDKQALLIVRGRFATEKLRKTAEGFVKEQPAVWKAGKEGDVTVYSLHDKAGQVQANLAFVTEGTVLVSAVRKTVTTAAAHDPKQPAKVSEALRKLVEKADAKDDVWLASVTPQHVRKLLDKSPYTSALAEDVTAFMGRLKADDGLKIAFSVHTKSKKTAEEVARLLDAAKTFASLGAADIDGVGPLLAALVDACKTSTDDGTATLSGELSAEEVAKAVKKK
jgi:hypothetical protein